MINRSLRIKFTKRQLKKIIADYRSGKTIAKISQKLNVNSDTIKKRLVSNGVRILKNGEWQKGQKPANYIKVSTENQKLCIKLWADNYSLSEIKNEVNFNENKIRDILLAQGIDTSRRRKKPANVECHVCSKRFRKRPARIKKINFCDRTCRGVFEQKRVIINCDKCDKEIPVIPYYVSRRKFCSNRCAAESIKNGEFVNCENCDKPFYKSAGHTRKYCSKKCMGLANMTAIQVECSMCNKKIKKNLCHIKGREFIFCGYDCAYRFRVENEEYSKSFKQKISKARKEYYKNHPEAKNDLRLKIIQRFKEGKYPRTRTIPHKLVCKILKSLRIPFKEEHPTPPFVSDIFLPKHKTIIEVQGTYWHADPRYYNNSDLNETQKSNVNRDKIKKDFIKNELGLCLIELWEYEITNDYNKVYDQLKVHTSSLKAIEI